MKMENIWKAITNNFRAVVSRFFITMAALMPPPTPAAQNECRKQEHNKSIFKSFKNTLTSPKKLQPNHSINFSVCFLTFMMSNRR